MATTTNFGWTTPDNTNLIKNGASDIRTLGSAIDTSFVDLKGGTAGQLLSKLTGTDLDFQWVDPNIGDITSITVSSPITGGGTSGDISIGLNTALVPLLASPNVFTDQQQINALASGIGLIVKANATTPGNLQEWQDSAGTILGKVSSAGYFGIPYVTAPGATAIRGQWNAATGSLIITPVTTTMVGIISRGMASQTGDLQQWQDSASTVLAKISSAGNLTVAAILTPNITGPTIHTGSLLFPSGNLYEYQPTPTSKATGATLTVAELQTRIITVTSANAVALTLPTGTLMDGGMPAGIAVNESFDWTIINLGSASGAVTITAGTGHTVVGNMVVAISTSGNFRSRRTAANTWVTYRL